MAENTTKTDSNFTRAQNPPNDDEALELIRRYIQNADTPHSIWIGQIAGDLGLPESQVERVNAKRLSDQAKV